MARYQLVDRGPRFLPIVLESPLMPGSFEHALDLLVDSEIDFSRLAARFCNDASGAPAYDPGVMLKIVLLAYSRGIISSRSIERLCRENVLFMAISGDSAPQFTTIAKFVRELGDEALAIFTQVLLICDRQGLIGRPKSHAHSRYMSRPISKLSLVAERVRRRSIGGLTMTPRLSS